MVKTHENINVDRVVTLVHATLSHSVMAASDVPQEKVRSPDPRVNRKGRACLLK